MIQVIPLRREEWESGVGPMDAARRVAQDEMFAASTHFYKEHFWQKVDFK